MITLYYTADYELYFASNHASPEETLLKPTAQLLQLCDKLAIGMTLFVDVACLWRYAEWGETTFVQQVEAQLRQAVAEGHDVQAHLHPHWLSCQRHGQQFYFPPSSYALGTLANEEEECHRQISGLLQRTVNYLENLLQPVQPTYHCRAFRAGGYRLDPRRSLLLQTLADHGFTVDSSIIPGYHQGEVDFRRESKQAGYWLTDPIFEVPIAAAPLSCWQAWRLGWQHAFARSGSVLFDRPLPSRGQPWTPWQHNLNVSRLKSAYWQWRGIMDRRFAHLEMGQDARLMWQVLHTFLSQNQYQEKPQHVAINGHPKGMYPPHLAALETFHRRAKNHYAPLFKTSTLGHLANALMEEKI